MLSYDEMREWSRLHGLVVNRCENLNCIDDGCARVRYVRGGTYVLEVHGGEVVRWRAYDLAAVRDAFARVDGAFDVLWQCSRAGRFGVVDVGQRLAWVGF